MRVDSKTLQNAEILSFEAFFSRPTAHFSALCAALLACALLAVTTSHATENDAIGANAITASEPIDRIEQKLRDIGQKARDTAADVTATALSLVGVDYKFGGNTPGTGLDCSGLVRYVFQQATGISLPRSSKEQAKVGQSIDKSQLQPGDLVFFNTRRFQFSHVGVYLGDNKFVHSPSRGGSVEVVNLDNRYWKKAYNGARRIVGALTGGDASAATLPQSVKAAVETLVGREPQPASASSAVVEAIKAPPSSATTVSPFTRDY